MTTELTPRPNCGEPSNNGRTCRLCESEDAMNKALTQRPAAPTAQQLESAAKVCDGFAAPDMAAALRGQRHAAQAYAPDKFCFTEADGSCSSKDPRCMHQPAAHQATKEPR